MAIHRIGPVRGVLGDLPPGPRQTATVAELNERAREVLRHVVEGYVETGEPVGSRALTRKLTETLSPATTGLETTAPCVWNCQRSLPDGGADGAANTPVRAASPRKSAGASSACARDAQASSEQRVACA